MACRRLGDDVTARDWFARAAEWADGQMPADEELQAFRAEAAELLGIPGRRGQGTRRTPAARPPCSRSTVTSERSARHFSVGSDGFYYLTFGTSGPTIERVVGGRLYNRGNWQTVRHGDCDGAGLADVAGRDPQTGNWWVTYSDGVGSTTKLGPVGTAPHSRPGSPGPSRCGSGRRAVARWRRTRPPPGTRPVAPSSRPTALRLGNPRRARPPGRRAARSRAADRPERGVPNELSWCMEVGATRCCRRQPASRLARRDASGPEPASPRWDLRPWPIAGLKAKTTVAWPTISSRQLFPCKLDQDGVVPFLARGGSPTQQSGTADASAGRDHLPKEGFDQRLVCFVRREVSENLRARG